jgi:hypothetical protein
LYSGLNHLSFIKEKGLTFMCTQANISLNLKRHILVLLCRFLYRSKI